jgi:hypothetical protein
MAQVTVRETFTIDGVLTNMTSVAFNGVAITPASAGIYEYTFTGLTGGTTLAYTVVYVYAGETYTETKTVAVPAESSADGLCTLADVKLRRGLDNTDNDTLIERIILGVAAAFESYCRRPLLLTAAAVTEYYTGQGPYMQLARYPIAAITSIKEAADFNFTDAEALTADEDYRIVRSGKSGILYSLLGSWDPNPDAIQVVYKGGYCYAGATVGSGETALPDDLREAAIEQAVFLFQRKDDMGLVSLNYQGGSINKQVDMNLLPQVRQILDNYRKPSL